MGLIAIGISWGLAKNLIPVTEADLTESSQNQVRDGDADLKIAAIYAGGTILLVGTRLFISPNGLSAWFNSLVSYFYGWRFVSGVPATRILLGLLAYYPLALFFGSIAIWRAFRENDRQNLFLALWAGVNIALSLLYPARQVSDLIWAGIPLWLLSASEIARYLHKPTFDRNEILGVFALTITLLVFSWLSLAGAGVLPENAQITSQHQYLLIASIGLLILSLALIAFGWSVEVAALGGAWGMILGLGIYTLGTAWGATGLRTPKGVEIWDSAPRVSQAGLLLQTVEEISTWSSGNAQILPITVSGVNSPALNWVLRNYDVNEVPSLDVTTAPELVITKQTDDVGLASAYRGQDFTWREEAAWEYMNSWAKWVVLREVPFSSEKII